LLSIALAIAVTFACSGQALLHDRFPEEAFVGHNEVGGFIIAVAGTLYAVILGFITVIAWQHFADARELVALESAAATDVWHVSIGLPAVQGSRVRSDMSDYAHLMVDKEWPAMRLGQTLVKPDLIIMDAISETMAFSPRTMLESNSQNATIQQLSALHDVRQRRLEKNDRGIAGFEWLVLGLGAVSVVCFCWLFGLANQRVHLLMTATVAIMIATTLVLLFELQYPFRTDLRIAPTQWLVSISHIHLMQTGSQPAMKM
jgi:hypothetical protein